MTSQWETLSVADGTQMRAYVAEPEGNADRGIIVLQEAFGVNDYVRRIAERFAGQGYLAVAPELFHRTAEGFEGSYNDFSAVGPHMHALTDNGLLADITAAHGLLLAQGIAAERIAVIGFCMGGRAAFLANTVLPLAASVSFYGGRIAESLLDRVSALHAPQLLCWGGKDDHILPEQTRAVADALRTAGKSYVEAVFSEGGHGFACDARASCHEPSAKEAWALTDAFLTTHIPILL